MAETELLRAYLQTDTCYSGDDIAAIGDDGILFSDDCKASFAACAETYAEINRVLHRMPGHYGVALCTLHIAASYGDSVSQKAVDRGVVLHACPSALFQVAKSHCGQRLFHPGSVLTAPYIRKYSFKKLRTRMCSQLFFRDKCFRGR